MAVKFKGFNGKSALFSDNDLPIIVNIKDFSVVSYNDKSVDDVYSEDAWTKEGLSAEAKTLATNVANASVEVRKEHFTDKNMEGRLYSPPKDAKTLAAKALMVDERRKVLSAESRNMAEKISTKQLGLDDIVRIAKFNASSDKGIRNDLTKDAWGGKFAAAWASELADRIGVDFQISNSPLDVSVFSRGDEDTRSFWADMPQPGVFGELKTFDDETGSWTSSANGSWIPCDPPNEYAVELDDLTAIAVHSARLDIPEAFIDVKELLADELPLIADAFPSLTWETYDRAMVAAGDDGEYTEEERSKNASAQLRDASGKFAKVGDSGLMKSGLRAQIKTLNPYGNQIVVKAEDGNTYMIPPDEFTIDGLEPTDNTGPYDQKIKNAPDATNPAQTVKPLDLAGILGQPRASTNTPKAWLKNLLQPMGPKQLKDVVNDYASFIKKERLTRARDFDGGTGWEESKAESSEERGDRKAHEENRDDRYQEVRDYYDSQQKKKNRSTRKSVKASGEPTDAGKISGSEAESPVDQKVTPDNSDVSPIYMAIVDPDDTRAVLELVSLVPSSLTSSVPTAFKRSGGEWIADPKIMQDLRSSTPPAVVKLDEATYQEVLEQVDGTPDIPEDVAEDGQIDATAPASAETPPVAASSGAPERVLTLVSAGGADRNRGGAEHLRRYWTVGKGGLKIRWGTPGDWRRCVRNLSKYLGPRAKGYCALRHHEMNGMWPGDKRNKRSFSLSPLGDRKYIADEITPLASMIAASSLDAAKEAAISRFRGDTFVPVPVSASDVDEGRSGRPFTIPLIVPENLSSGDKRRFNKGSLGIRTLPLPLLWQQSTGEGHDGAVIVGRIDHVERTEHGLGNAYGVFDTGPFGKEAERLVDNGMLRWVSVDLDKFELDEAGTEADPDGKMHIKKGRMMAATLVAKPAFQECTVELMPLTMEGPTLSSPDERKLVASAGISSSIPVEPPATWFNRPVLNGPTPLRVTDEGQVYGHIATWSTSHVGLPNQVKPPRSRSNYAYFTTGVVRTAEGKDVKVGQLTLAGGHADLRADMAAAVKHYDDTGSAMADVAAGEDSYGIWVAGALRPGVTPEQIRAFRASAPSGDWRSVNGGPLELVAVCQVNVPGFPVPQSLAASGAAMTSLVAAGRAELVYLQEASTSQDRTSLVAAAEDAKNRVKKALDIEGYLALRDEAALEGGKALSDGSFPIRTEADIRRAVLAANSMPDNSAPRVRRHIVRQARSLSASALVPASWRESNLSNESLDRRDKYDSRVAKVREAKAAALRDRVNAPALAASAADAAKRIKAAK